MEYILKNSLLRRTLDNVTVVIVSFANFKRKVFHKEGDSANPTPDIKDVNNSVENDLSKNASNAIEDLGNSGSGIGIGSSGIKKLQSVKSYKQAPLSSSNFYAEKKL